MALVRESMRYGARGNGEAPGGVLRYVEQLHTEHTEHADHTDPPMLHADITEQVLGSYYDVYREHGYGYLEAVYSRSLLVELQHRGIPVQREVLTDVMYKGVNVGTYRADFVVARKVLVEVKANHSLTGADERQVLNYLKALKLEVALLLNFGPKPEFRRLILTRH